MPSATPTPRSNLSVPAAPPSSLRALSLGSQSAQQQQQQQDSSGSMTPRRASLLATPPGGKSRARDLLRKHYGLGVGLPPPRVTGNPNDPMDLNSPAFDAKSYYEQLITTSSLPTLLRRENELLSEIRQLDSERQSLVYNHHGELIAASDMIGAMKTHAESLDADLDLLKAAFSEISRLSAEVSIENHHSSSSPSAAQNHDRNVNDLK